MLESEAAAQKCSVKKVFLEISQNSQAQAYNFIKKETLAQVFLPMNFAKFLQKLFLTENLWWLFL